MGRRLLWRLCYRLLPNRDLRKRLRRRLLCNDRLLGLRGLHRGVFIHGVVLLAAARDYEHRPADVRGLAVGHAQLASGPWRPARGRSARGTTRGTTCRTADTSSAGPRHVSRTLGVVGAMVGGR
jgi:hypothetical protein